MKYLLAAVLLLPALNSHGRTEILFNGKDLSGWESGRPELWRVENGELVGSFETPIKTSDFLWSDKSYGNFRLSFKVKVSDDWSNSGIQFWSEPHSRGAKGFQADIGSGYWGFLFEENARGLMRKSLKDTVKIREKDWNDYEIQAVDGHIILKINGIVVQDYKDDGEIGLTRGRKPGKGKVTGRFGIQLHPGFKKDARTEIRFKDFELTLLDAKPGADANSNPPNEPQKPKRKLQRDKHGGEGNFLDVTEQTPEEQLSGFRLPEGFVIENVSHEGLGAIKPVSLNFDDAGRLWTQTAAAYPVENKPKTFELEGDDKVLVFPTPHLQQPQKPEVFAEGLVMPLSVLPHNDGVHVINGTHILRFRDTDGDGKADQKTVLMSGFDVKDSHTSIHQLTWGPGNWIYFSQGVLNSGTVTTADGEKIPFNQALMARYRPDGTGLNIIGEGMNNVWAWAINREGRTYIHEANNFGYSQAAFERDATYPSFLQTASRNPLQHPPTAPDLALEGTGFSGIATAGTSGRDFPPPWRDFNFVANPITGEINAVSYTVDESGNHHFKREADLLTSDDPMFRPVNIGFGPDGCLYVIDWYNRVISHGTTTTNLDKHARTLGRIWRIRHRSQQPFTPVDIGKAPDQDLVAHLASRNLWEMRAAINQIGKRQTKELVPGITRLVQKADTEDSVRIHGLWALESLNHFDLKLWSFLLKHHNPNVRHEALRSLSNLQPELNQALPLFESLKGEKSFHVSNELIRFFRDTPQPLDASARQFIQTFYTAPDKLPDDMVKGWKGPHHALGGAYEKRFRNALIGSIGKKETGVPTADEEKWSQVIEEAAEKTAAEEAVVDAEIERLAGLIGKKPEGNLEKGARSFASRCATCHDAVKGFAPPLGGSGQKPPAEILTAIFKPDDAAEELFHSYKVYKKDGTAVEGFRSDLSDKELTLTFMGGAKATIPLSEIKKAGYIKGKSVMPAGMTSGMSDQDMIDLMHYIGTLK